MQEILVGTSGWSYDDWVGPVYPRSLDRDRWLNHYGDRFPTVEVNFTHYRLPERDQIATITDRMLDAGLRSAVYKAPRSITHEAIPDQDADSLEDDGTRFLDALDPVADAQLLDGLLVQFSHTAGPDVVLEGLERLRALGLPAPLFVEVRHAAFNEDRHYEDLRELAEGQGGAVVATDSPAATITKAPPAERAYFRFHGRNEQTWFQKDPEGVHGSARYDHLYGEDEIAELAERIEAARAERIVVYFNNHARGKAPRNALMLMDRLGIPSPSKRVTLDDFG